MALIVSGTSPRKKEYQDSTDWSKTATATANLQPVNRKVNGSAVQQQVVVREYKLRRTVCTSANACSSVQLDSPQQFTLRYSGPVGVSADDVLADLIKMVSTSGNLHTPVLTEANFS